MVDRLLAPIDGSENAERALRFAADMARRYDAALDVVHVTDVEGESTDELLDRARAVLEEEDGVSAEPQVAFDLRLTFHAADRVGEAVLGLVDDEGYDHVVMGHTGAGAVERLVLGSATETVIRANEVAVTVVP